LFSFISLDQLLADLQNVSQRARTAYEKSDGETRLEPMVLNRNPPAHRNQTLNLIRPDSIVDPVCSFNKFSNLIFQSLGTSTKKFE
jgi:hypothetical protein